MIFNLFLPLISFMILLGDYIKGGFFFSTVFFIVSVITFFYYASIARMVFFEAKKMKESFMEIPVESLESGKVYKIIMNALIWPFLLGIIYLCLKMGSFYLAIAWGVNLLMLGLFMYRLYHLKQQIIAEHQAKNALDEQP